MGSTYTEEEFKKVLKNLFSEKKRVKDLQRALEDKSAKKFNDKLLMHQRVASDEAAHLQAAYAEKEQEFHSIKQQLEKVKPALRTLVSELKKARHEIEVLRTAKGLDGESSKQIKEKEEQLLASLSKAQERIARLEEEKRVFEEESKHLAQEEGELFRLREEMLLLEEELDRGNKKRASLEEEKAALETALKNTTLSFEQKQEELVEVRASIQKESQRFELDRARIVERLAESLSQIQRQTDTIKELREELQTSHRKVEGADERGKFYEIQLDDLKNQLLPLREEKEGLQKRLNTLAEEADQERQAFTLQSEEWEKKESYLLQLEKDFEEAKSQLQGSGVAALREEYEAKIAEQQAQTQRILEEALSAKESSYAIERASMEEAIAHLRTELASTYTERDQIKAEMRAEQEQFVRSLAERETDFEQQVERYYFKMRELSQRYSALIEEKEVLRASLEEKTNRLSKGEKEFASCKHNLQNAKLQCEEKDAEIRKAQQHLAKKVKETTVLRDLAERQKMQISELQHTHALQTTELEQMQHSLNMQRVHDEKFQAIAKERTEVAENQMRHWQDKYLALQQDWQEKKSQLNELQKMRKHFEQMTSTVSSLKNMLGRALEPPISEEKKEIELNFHDA